MAVLKNLLKNFGISYLLVGLIIALLSYVVYGYPVFNSLIIFFLFSVPLLINILFDPQKITTSRIIGGIAFLAGIIGYLSSRNIIEANQIQYEVSMLKNEWSGEFIVDFMIFAAKYGLVVALIGIGFLIPLSIIYEPQKIVLSSGTRISSDA